jgi:hypothetical protein
MTKLRGVGVVMVFLVGCAVGGAASRFAVPPASAQQAASGRQWEHFCINASDPREAASRAGWEGWEMVTAGGGGSSPLWWCFKRPKG